MVRAGLAWLAVDEPTTLAHLRECEGHFDKAGMQLRRAGAMWRRAKIVGGEEGERLLSQTRDAMASIVDAEKMARVLSPGFAPR
jgi:hypothetical protein